VDCKVLILFLTLVCLHSFTFCRKIVKVEEYFQFLKMSGFEFGQIGKTCDPSEPAVSSNRCGDAHSVMSQPVPVEEGGVSGYVFYLLYQIDYLEKAGE
jgi:hypothetical protein